MGKKPFYPFSVSLLGLLVRALLASSLASAEVMNGSRPKATSPSTIKAKLLAPEIAPAKSYCAVNDQGATIVRPELYELDAKLKERLEAWAKGVKELGTSLKQTREQLLVEGVVLRSVSEQLNQARPKLTSFKEQLFILLGQLPAAYRQQGQLAMISYFKMALSLVELELYVSPRSVGLDDLRFKYSLELPPVAIERYFQDGHFSIADVEIEPVVRDNKMSYRLALSAETTFFAMTRAAARSPEIKTRSESYIETVRCILGRSVLSKLTLNKTLSNQPGVGPTILDPEQKFCLGSKARDFIRMSDREIETSRELTLRTIFLKNIPQAAAHLPDEVKLFILTSGLAENMSNLFAFPQLLPFVNEGLKKDGKQTVSPENFAILRRKISQTFDSEFAKFKALEALRSIWLSPNIQARLTGLFNDCKVSMNESGKVKTIDDYTISLTYGDDFEFLMNLYANVRQIPGHWLEMDKSQLSLTLRNYILTTKVTASLKSIEYLLGFQASGESGDVDQIMGAATEDLSKALHSEYDRIWKAEPALQAWLDTLVDTIFKEKDNAQNSKLQLGAFTSELMKQAVLVKDILDTNKPAGDLPYQEDQVLQSLAAAIKSLSPENRRRYQILIEETNSDTRHELWGQIYSIMKKEAEQKGASCGNDGAIERVSNLLGGWFQQQKSIDKATLTQDCTQFALVAGAIGSDRKTKPSDLSFTLAYLQSKLSPDEVKDFIDTYRRLAAARILAEYRLLDLPTSENGKEKFWQRLSVANDAATMIPEVTAGLQKSVISLEGYLKTIVAAKKEEDLTFFIKRTRVINAILGEGVLPKVIKDLNAVQAKDGFSQILSSSEVGFVFPTLLRHHTQLQDKWVNSEDLNTEVWGEFVYANSRIVLAVVGGWALKHALGVLPTFSGAPALASLIDRTGSRLSSVISAHMDFFILVLLGHIAVLHHGKAGLENELGLIEKLYASDGALQLEFSSPLPLISNAIYLQQNELYTSEIKKTQNSLYETYAWIAFPFVFNYGAKILSKATTKMRIKKDTDFSSYGFKGKQSFENSSRMGIDHQLSLLSNDLRVLGNPKSMELGLLKSGYENAKAAAKSTSQIKRIDEAYERVITSFGEKIGKYADTPHLKQSYANALYGNGASTKQLDLIYQEYIRLSRAGGL